MQVPRSWLPNGTIAVHDYGFPAAMATLPDPVGLITSTDDPLSLERLEQALASLYRRDGNAVPAGA